MIAPGARVDLQHQPIVDAHLRHLGQHLTAKLRALAGIWENDQGEDVKPTADGAEASQPPRSSGIYCPPSQGSWLDALRPACASWIATGILE